MKAFLQAVQTKLATIPELEYIDEDWGQMDAYSAHPPAKFPCSLIDITSMVFSDVGRDSSQAPENRQLGNGTVTIIVADLKIGTTGQKAPQQQKDNAWRIWTIIEKVHVALHGWRPTTLSGALMRTSSRRIRRDDGIQEYQITYSIGMTNV